MCEKSAPQSISISDLINNNRDWSRRMQERDPEFFTRLVDGQSPGYLWIGCGDSRVPAETVLDVPPGTVFVHRSVANVIYNNDVNTMAAVEFAVDSLKVRDILVVGHYGCGGVNASMNAPGNGGILDDWLHPIRQEYVRRREELSHLPNQEQHDRMCEINVRMQVRNLASTRIVQRAWLRGQPLTIHGWCHSLKDGLINNLECTVSGFDKVPQLYRLD
ncbi:carbonic anhydrase [Carnimonas nigrificans]|uniref:carbonic anhydrase n=1 Tax=Carnimonas nigrificans TaxID=64323 RepID=UPI00046FD0A1|nr:carbonic anhydrase [Carnimonas nigrificans]